MHCAPFDPRPDERVVPEALAEIGSERRMKRSAGPSARRAGPRACDAHRINHSLHPLLAGRWSPTRFDPTHEIAPDQVEVLLEAARWAPSAGNSQPWAFIIARRGTAEHTRLVRHLAGSSGAWAPSASLLVANLSHRFVEDTDWEFSEFSVYDLGGHSTATASPRSSRSPSTGR
jgi:hypothetical protein